MIQAIPIIQLILSFLLIVFILLQGRGAGLGSSFGGGGEFYSTKRGIERLLFSITVILIIAFLLISIISAAIS